MNNPFFEFLIVDCVAAATGLFDLRTQCLRRADGAMREPLELCTPDDIRDPLLGKEGENGLTD